MRGGCSLGVAKNALSVPASAAENTGVEDWRSGGLAGAAMEDLLARQWFVYLA